MTKIEAKRCAYCDAWITNRSRQKQKYCQNCRRYYHNEIYNKKRPFNEIEMVKGVLKNGRILPTQRTTNRRRKK